MKTKTFLLLCLLLVIGMTQLSAQNENKWKNVDRSYAGIYELVGGWFPITCDGVDFDMLDCDGKIHIVDHVKNGVWQWEIAEAKWEATSIKTGEVFTGKELDKSTYIDPVTYYFYGTWRAIMHGNRGSRYQITIAVSFTPGFNWSLIKANCY